MPRVSPDSNDMLVWLCNDAASSTSIFNEGSAGSAGDLTKNLNPILGAQGFFGNGLFFNGSGLIKDYFSGAASIEPTGNTLSVSFWVYVRGSWAFQSGNNAHFVGKLYRNDNSWSSPFLSYGIGLFNSGGNWGVTQNISGNSRSVNGNTINHPFPLSTWTHIGSTYDGTTIRLYINGIPVSTGSFSGTTDYGTHGSWFIGSIPATSSVSAEQSGIIINDIRIANIVRPLSYFQNIYSQGVLV